MIPERCIAEVVARLPPVANVSWQPYRESWCVWISADKSRGHQDEMRRLKKPPKHPDIRRQEQCLVYAKNKLFKEKEVKEKAVRQDVKERALTNANSTFTVVKTTWKALGRRAVRL